MSDFATNHMTIYFEPEAFNGSLQHICICLVSHGCEIQEEKKGKGVISWLHPAETKYIPGSHVSAAEHHLAGMLSEPLNYQQLLNDKQ